MIYILLMNGPIREVDDFYSLNGLLTDDCNALMTADTNECASIFAGL